MKTREEALEYGLSFPDTYTEMPFHDPNWQLVRVKGSKKAFLWTYEKDGVLHLHVNTDPAWRKRIPQGCVATYGQVAAFAGEP